MSGTLNIPNVIDDLPGPRQPASLLDDNWQAIADYINPRQVTFDVIGNRPAAGVPSRTYYATDEATLYLDNGTSWITVAGGGAGGGTASLPGSVNQNSVYSSGDPDIFTLIADRVVVAPLAGTGNHFLSAVSVSVDLTVVGANGRDQASALSANSWGHLYWIYNPTTATVAGLVSSAAWPTSSPTLPSGYTELAYAGAARINGSSQFAAMAIRGRRSVWFAAQQVLTDGSASSATVISCATAVPPNARWCWGYASLKNTVAAAGPEYVVGEVSMDTGGTPLPIVKLTYALDTTYAGAAAGGFDGFPLSQNLYYKIVDAAGAAADGTNLMQVFVSAFENPNGG